MRIKTLLLSNINKIAGFEPTTTSLLFKLPQQKPKKLRMDRQYKEYGYSSFFGPPNHWKIKSYSNFPFLNFFSFKIFQACENLCYNWEVLLIYLDIYTFLSFPQIYECAFITMRKRKMKEREREWEREKERERDASIFWKQSMQNSGNLIKIRIWKLTHFTSIFLQLVIHNLSLSPLYSEPCYNEWFCFWLARLTRRKRPKH